MTGTENLTVNFFTLTDARASEHIYMGNLKRELENRGVEAVADWRDADVVHLFEVNFFTTDALLGGEIATLLRILRSDTPVVISTDDLYFIDRAELTARPVLYGLNRRTQRWLFGQADRIVAISESVERALPIEHTEVVRHGVTDEYFAESARADSGETQSAGDDSSDSESPDEGPEPFVFHASLASKRKNPEAVLETASRLDARFVLAGGGWDEKVPDRLREENVEVRGYVPEAELIDLYHRADVFYFPTHHEGFGLPVLEAMAGGCAVVTSDAYAVPEVAGDAAVLADPTDVDAHVAEIRRLLDDEAARRELGRTAAERAREFSWADAAAETERVYRDVVNR
ncbi:glycosyltransferase family 4 protein [Halorussus lipolyticus]|uniref:glycosyltransferase family 4 protein n=1 Tax=Halorussus lipolyticus TaxID=3034024 RepID=UPI0023E81585|nr:glycosyltransferase family 1 protein [Halorussus sp. DT80]